MDHLAALDGDHRGAYKFFGDVGSGLIDALPPIREAIVLAIGCWLGHMAPTYSRVGILIHGRLTLVGPDPSPPRL